MNISTKLSNLLQNIKLSSSKVKTQKNEPKKEDKKEESLFNFDNKSDNNSLYGDAISISKTNKNNTETSSSKLSNLLNNLKTQLDKNKLNVGNSSEKAVKTDSVQTSETKQTKPTVPTVSVTPTKPAVPTIPKTDAKTNSSKLNVLLINLKNKVNNSGKSTVTPTVSTAPTLPTAPTVPTEPTTPTVPTEPTMTTTPTVPTVPTVPTTSTVPVLEPTPVVALEQINRFFNTNFSSDNTVITKNSDNQITNIKQYSDDKTKVIYESNLYYDKDNNIALYIENNIENESSVYNGIVNKDNNISYTQYSEEYLSKVSSNIFPILTSTLETFCVNITNKLSDINFSDFNYEEEVVEDGKKYDLYQKESNITLDNVKYNVFEYKSSMYDSANKVEKMLYYKEIYDENWVKISELAQLYDSNGNLEVAQSLINYTENGIALTKQNQYAVENNKLKESKTISWNPEDSIKAGYLNPLRLIDMDDTPTDVVTQKINELKKQLNAKKQEKADNNDEIEELEDLLFDLQLEAAIAYAESFSDIGNKEARPYKEVLAEIEQVEAEIEALRNQNNTLSSEILSLEKQIADYSNSATARDNKIDDFEQGELGDCYLISELRHRGEVSEDIVKWNDDGSVDVSLYKVTQNEKSGFMVSGDPVGFEIGEQQTFNITAKELERNTININGKDWSLASNDLTVKAIEIANIKIGNDATEKGYHPSAGKAILDGDVAYGYDAGKYGDNALEGVRTAMLPQNDDPHNENLIKNIGTSMAMDGSLYIDDVKGNSVKINNHHVYDVKYNSDDDTVTVTNPWDTANKSYTFDKEIFKKTFQISTTNKQSAATSIWKQITW